MTQDKLPKNLGRRQALIRGGLAAGGLVAASVAPAAQAAKSAGKQQWDHEADVVCIGSGAAACSAAVTAAGLGAKVILVEKMPLPGGTTGKSGGVTWIPNNPLLRARGINDERTDCLRFLARYAYPRQYTPNSATLGLPDGSYRLLEAFYDNGSPMIENMDKLGAVRFREFKMWFVDKYAPDYADHLPENKTPRGRALEPAVGASSAGGGASLAAQMEKWLAAKGTPILLEHRVTNVVKDGDRVVGVEALYGDKLVRIKARKGVVFGTGGYAHNASLCGLPSDGPGGGQHEAAPRRCLRVAGRRALGREPAQTRRARRPRAQLPDAQARRHASGRGRKRRTDAVRRGCARRGDAADRARVDLGRREKRLTPVPFGRASK
ncbi:MAG: FAD-dependent oxidoreductase [Aromatoleum sp.]|uniref:FAD-dependent oxidoreductase n=1 Tax=Aromatoleum sp. TaxID=2307007 RepID=UPI0028954D8B|nr:FAD-dependent oxidoreductase [Aromatoleum sp.]MDT3671002.1 FAD-dependent oxidoreductase [Aromatoleum sp.]